MRVGRLFIHALTLAGFRSVAVAVVKDADLVRGEPRYAACVCDHVTNPPLVGLVEGPDQDPLITEREKIWAFHHICRNVLGLPDNVSVDVPIGDVCGVEGALIRELHQRVVFSLEDAKLRTNLW